MNFDSSVLQVAIEDIIPNRFQPRLVFEDASLNELAASIKQHGIIQPLVLRKMGEKYEIVAGERRYKAARMAGLSSVPAVISLIDDKKSAEVAIAENVQRKELTAIEEAKSYKALLDQGYMSQEQLARKLGLSESAVANKLRLLTLAPEVQSAILEGKISERHARSLLVVKDNESQVKWLNRIIEERLPVRMLDLELRKEYGETVMNNGINIEQVKQTATDIPTFSAVQNTPAMSEPLGFSPINLGQKTTNKFFNNLENEAVNMQMTEAVNPFLQQSNPMGQPVSNDGFAVASVTPEPTPAPVAPVSPISFTQYTQEEVANTLQNTPNNAIDSLDSLDVMPTSNTPVSNTKSIADAKTKINSLIEELKQMGYNINSSATELSDSVTFTISVNL